MKRLNKFLKKKQSGSSIYIWIAIIFLTLVMFFSVSLFERSADTLSDNLKTSLDSANLAATTVNMDRWLENGRPNITGYNVSETTLSEEEKNSILKRYTTYQQALMDNVGLDNDFSFKGGTCGWAGNYVSSGTLTIKDFIVYDVINDDVYSYTISNIKSKTENPTIEKSYIGKVGAAKTIEYYALNGDKESKEITNPMVLSEIEFPVNIRFLRNIGKWVSNEDINSVNNITVGKSSITEIKRDNDTLKEECDHEFESKFTADKLPTCTEPGLESQHCKKCSAITNQREIPALGHTIATNKAFSATCTSTGLTEGTYCSVCNEVITKQEIIPALGHDEISANNAVAATCTTNGKQSDTICSRCGETLTEGKPLSALGHNPVSANNAISATCTAIGKKTDTKCSRCGKTLTTGDTIPALGHNWVSANNAKSATCTNAGKYADTICSRCGKIGTTGATIPALGHNYISLNNAVAATCTKTGKQSDYQCTRCGNIAIGAALNALGHSSVSANNAKAATCTAAGKKSDTKCSRCGITLTTGASISALGHDWCLYYNKHTTINHKCSSCGYTQAYKYTATCSRCSSKSQRTSCANPNGCGKYVSGVKKCKIKEANGKWRTIN